MQNIVLGIGSNVGQKVLNLNQAISLINQKIGLVKKVSPIYQTKALLPPNAPSSWDIDYYNLCALLQTHLRPEDLLIKIKSIEVALGRNSNHAFWSPREIDIDILCFENLFYNSPTLTIPHRGLLKRSFALRPLLDVYPDWPCPLMPINDLYKRLELISPKFRMLPFSVGNKNSSKIMGIINLSQDSFSQNNAPVIPLKDFSKHITNLVNQGADIIDVGAESTKPLSQPISSKLYLERLLPYLDIIESLTKSNSLPIDLKVSVDTYHAGVVSKLLNYSCVKIINDVYGSQSEKIVSLIKDKNMKYVFMHQLGFPGGRYLNEKINLKSQIITFAKNRITKLLSYGIGRNKLIFDIGIGFGKNFYQSKLLLDSIHEIKELIGVEILVGHSRKASVMQYVANEGNEQKDIATAMISRDLIRKGIDYLRVHNVSLAGMSRFI